MRFDSSSYIDVWLFFWDFNSSRLEAGGVWLCNKLLLLAKAALVKFLLELNPPPPPIVGALSYLVVWNWFENDGGLIILSYLLLTLIWGIWNTDYSIKESTGWTLDPTLLFPTYAFLPPIIILLLVVSLLCWWFPPSI